MSIRVRSQEGEVSFTNMSEVESALHLGLVDATDEMMETGSSEWRKIGDRVAPAKSQWKDHYHWYVLAGILIAMAVLGVVGFLVVVFITSSHAIWLRYIRPHGRRHRAPRRLR
jgi:hypothetical protein